MLSVVREGKEYRSLSHNNAKCLGCGICADVCPTNSINLGPILPIARGLLKTNKITINDDCCLCGLCASACPFDSLDLNIENVNTKNRAEYPKWAHYAQINEKECIYCGRCEKSCPQEAIYLNRTLPDVRDLVKGESEVDHDKCIYCGICEEMCPAEAITMHRNQINSSNQSIASSVEIDESKCIYCSICKKICPVEAIKIVCTTCMAHEDIKIPEIKGNIILDQKACVNCGWCQWICPVEAAEVSKPFEGDLVYDEDFTCKGDTCHACEDVCPCNAISIVEGKSKVNPLFCTLCGACAKSCPQEGITIKRNKMKLENIRSKSWQKRLSLLIEGSS